MLLPALSKAKEKSKQVSCLNNQKQMGVGQQMFADDSDSGNHFIYFAITLRKEALPAIWSPARFSQSALNGGHGQADGTFEQMASDDLNWLDGFGSSAGSGKMNPPGKRLPPQFAILHLPVHTQLY